MKEPVCIGSDEGIRVSFRDTHVNKDNLTKSELLRKYLGSQATQEAKVKGLQV